MAETKFYLKVVDNATTGINSVSNAFGGMMTGAAKAATSMRLLQTTMAAVAGSFVIRKSWRLFEDIATSTESARAEFDKSMNGIKTAWADIKKESVAIGAAKELNDALRETTQILIENKKEIAETLQLFVKIAAEVAKYTAKGVAGGMSFMNKLALNIGESLAPESEKKYWRAERDALTGAGRKQAAAVVEEQKKIQQRMNIAMKGELASPSISNRYMSDITAMYNTGDSGLSLPKDGSATFSGRLSGGYQRDMAAMYAENQDAYLSVVKSAKGPQFLQGTTRGGPRAGGIDGIDESLYGNDYGAPMAQNFATGWRVAMGQITEDFNQTFGSMVALGRESAKEIAMAMSDSFNDFFVDAIEGRIRQFKDYLMDFFKSIGRAIANMLSQYIAVQALGAIMPGVTPTAAAGGGGATATGGANTAVAVGRPKATATGAIMPSVAPASVAGGANTAAVVGRPKATAVGATSPTIQIINNSGTPLTGTAAYSQNDMGETIMTIVLDAVGRNKGGSRDALRGMLA